MAENKWVTGVKQKATRRIVIEHISRWWQLNYYLFSPRKLGKITILTNIFQMGWNHQLDL